MEGLTLLYDLHVFFTHTNTYTHALSQKCIKLLYSESKRGHTLLYYIAGNRVLRYTQRAFTNERTLTKLLR